MRLGKTVMPDLGMLSSGVSSLHGVTRNPWNPAWTPGGSSAGAAAAGAARLGPLHVGSDIGGSVRLPAGWTGLASLKPSFGLVPVDPPYQGRVIGPLARTVDDVALLMQVLAREDPAQRDYTYLQLPGSALGVGVAGTADGRRSVRGLRVGRQTDAGERDADRPRGREIIDEVANTFARAGADVEPVEPFLAPEMLEQLDLFWRARFWSALQQLAAPARDQDLPYIYRWASAAAALSGSAVIEAHHAVQDIRRVTLRRRTASTCLFPRWRRWPPSPRSGTDRRTIPTPPWRTSPITVPYNFSEQPAATVNAGFTPDGRPVGVQLAGRRFGDVDLLRIARWYEAARPESARPSWPDD